MSRPRVICELSAYLGILLRWGLRSGKENEPAVELLVQPGEIEREGLSPAFMVQLQSVVPDLRAARSTAVFEATDESRAGPRVEVSRPPLWVACRYLAGVRGRSPDEDQEMLAAVLRTLHDHPLLTPEHLPSLRQIGGVDRFPLELTDESEGWRRLGLSHPRVLVSFQVMVPIISAQSRPLEHVFEREIRLGELT